MLTVTETAETNQLATMADGIAHADTQGLINQGASVETQETPKRKSNAGVKYANAKVTIEALENRHDDPLMNREQMLKNFSVRYIKGGFDQYGDDGLEKLIEFVREAWEFEAKASLADLQKLLGAYKNNPMALALIQEETGLQPPKSTAKKA